MAATAYDTFKFAFDRSVYLYRLYSGLTNHRQRAIRSDWASNFCTLMRWNQADAATIDRIDSSDALIVLRPHSRLTKDAFDSDVLSDLLRASLVMGVSALDAYFHSKILSNVVRCARRGSEMPNSLKNCTITIEEFVDGSGESRRMNTVRRSLDNHLGYQSLQQPDKIEQAVSLIGIRYFWNNVAARCGVNAEDLKESLSKVVRRRNQIAHEGDLSRGRRTRNQDRSLSPKEARDGLVLIRRIAGRSEAEINAQFTE